MTKRQLIANLIIQAEKIPNPVIEYNFDLEEEDIKEEDFKGIAHKLNPDTPKGSANIIYKFN